jgi:hypothetical protein
MTLEQQLNALCQVVRDGTKAKGVVLLVYRGGRKADLACLLDDECHGTLATSLRKVADQIDPKLPKAKQEELSLVQSGSETKEAEKMSPPLGLC